jgi:hypothetical protein
VSNCNATSSNPPHRWIPSVPEVMFLIGVTTILLVVNLWLLLGALALTIAQLTVLKACTDPWMTPLLSW